MPLMMMRMMRLMRMVLILPVPMTKDGCGNFSQVCCRLTLPSFFADSQQQQGDGVKTSQGGDGVKTGVDEDGQTGMKGKISFGDKLSNKEQDGVKIDRSAWNVKEEKVAGDDEGNNQLEQPTEHRHRFDKEEREEEEAKKNESGLEPTDSLSNGDKAETTGDGWAWI